MRIDELVLELVDLFFERLGGGEEGGVVRAEYIAFGAEGGKLGGHGGEVVIAYVKDLPKRDVERFAEVFECIHLGGVFARVIGVDDEGDGIKGDAAGIRPLTVGEAFGATETLKLFRIHGG